MSFLYVKWLNHVWCDSSIRTRIPNAWHIRTYVPRLIHMSHDSCICPTTLLFPILVTESWHIRHTNKWVMVHTCHDSFICPMTRPYVTTHIAHMCHDSFIRMSYVPWLIHMSHDSPTCHTTHPFSFLAVLPCLQAQTLEFNGKTFQQPPAVDTVGNLEIRYHGCQGATWDDVSHLVGVCVCVCACERECGQLEIRCHNDVS